MTEDEVKRSATLCTLFEECCRKMGLEYSRNAGGVSAEMEGGSMLFLYAVPRKLHWQGRTITLYGYIHRGCVRRKYLDSKAVKILYDKIKQTLET